MGIKEFLESEIARIKPMIEDPDPNIMVMELAHEEIIMHAYMRALEAGESDNE